MDQLKGKEPLFLMEALEGMKDNGEKGDMMAQLYTSSILLKTILWLSMKEVGPMGSCKVMECFHGLMEVITVDIGLMERDKVLENTLNMMEMCKRDGGRMTYSQENLMICFQIKSMVVPKEIKAIFDIIYFF